MSLDEAVEYDERFSEHAKNTFKIKNISPEIANAFDKEFNYVDIMIIRAHDISPDMANFYANTGLLGRKATSQVELMGCESGEEYYSPAGSDVAFLYESLCPITEAMKYNQRFTGMNIAMLYEQNINWNIANTYIESVSPQTIMILDKIGITPDADVKVQEKIEKIISKIYLSCLDLWHSNKYNFIGCGANAFVVLDKEQQVAIKYGLNLAEESKRYKQLYECNHGILRNNIKIEYWLEDAAPKNVGLEYINGDSLENSLKQEGPFPAETVLKYGTDILNGIWELRNAGLYHNDLHDRNIMIDKDNDRAVIIDLGTSTENPEEVNPLNRAYGGNNDLISLGQLMYKMATGHNLFKESPGFTFYSEVKEGIRSKREEVYSTFSKKREYLDKVRCDVPGKLGELIEELLNDELMLQPSMKNVHDAKAMFERYMDEP